MFICRCVVAGWGQIQPTNYATPTKLKQVNVNTVDINKCEQGFNGQVDTVKYLDKTGGQICAGGETQRDACFVSEFHTIKVRSFESNL